MSHCMLTVSVELSVLGENKCGGGGVCVQSFLCVFWQRLTKIHMAYQPCQLLYVGSSFSL